MKDGIISESPYVTEAMYEDAVSVVREAGVCRFSLLQRKMRINFNKASKLCDILESRGVIGAVEGAGFKQVIIPSNTEADAR